MKGLWLLAGKQLLQLPSWLMVVAGSIARRPVSGSSDKLASGA